MFVLPVVMPEAFQGIRVNHTKGASRSVGANCMKGAFCYLLLLFILLLILAHLKHQKFGALLPPTQL